MTDITEERRAIDKSKWISGPVGMCMSGGGYRAAAFHLGALGYLDRVGLRGQLGAISTVSGGTFTGAKYILSLVEKREFNGFFNGFYQELKDTNLVAEGLSHLAARHHKVASGRQDLIVSMADVYAEKMFCKKEADGKTTPYYFDTILNGDQPVGDVIFNSTDFRSGDAFKFQRRLSPDAPVGNEFNNISRADAAQIRLSDIVAASSCFPGGFEPFSFPYDFTWQGGEPPTTVQERFPFQRDYRDPRNFRGPAPLMDGGIYDNQGLENLLTADEDEGDRLDLIVVSDVDQPTVSLYEMPAPGDNGGITLSWIRRLGIVFMILCTVTMVAIGIHVVRDWNEQFLTIPRLTFLYVIPFILASASVFSVRFFYQAMRNDVLPHIPQVGSKAWDSLKRLTVGQIRNMLRLRLTSLLTLTSSVFMTRVRGLVYALLYGHHDNDVAAEKFKGKRIANVMYTLSPAETAQTPFPAVAKPSADLAKVACVAFNQGTTLWFDKSYQEPCLAAAGQASLCYNLIKLMAERYGDNPDKFAPEVKVKFDQLCADWTRFNDDPFFALRDVVTGENWDAIKREALAVKCNWGRFEVAAK